jgi:hypothetical protein
MLDSVMNFISEHSMVIGWITSIAVFVAGTIWAFIARKSSYIYYEHSYGPQALWMVILSASYVIAGITWYIWYITIPLIVVGILVWRIRLSLKSRVDRRMRTQH